VKLLVDVGVGKVVEDWLRTQGHNVLTVRDLDPHLPDEEILERAVREKRLIITMDKDFGELVHRSERQHAGVLLLRLEAADSATKVAVVQRIFEQREARLLGKFAVYRRGQLRIRKGV
jgi:predicted nuclease of predicted toxin-antitoxin system